MKNVTFFLLTIFWCVWVLAIAIHIWPNPFNPWYAFPTAVTIIMLGAAAITRLGGFWK